MPTPFTSAARRAAAQHGFTLIEVMITVAIVAILAAIALPAYSDYLRRGQMPEAFTFLSDYRVKMEQYYQDNRNYGSGSCAQAGGAGPSWNTFAPSAKYFTFSCALTNVDQGYLLTATGNGGLTTGYVYTIDTNNTRQTTLFKGAGVAKNCWLVKGDEC